MIGSTLPEDTNLDNFAPTGEGQWWWRKRTPASVLSTAQADTAEPRSALGDELLPVRGCRGALVYSTVLQEPYNPTSLAGLSREWAQPGLRLISLDDVPAATTCREEFSLPSSSTAMQIPPIDVTRLVEVAFSAAHYEVFRDGEESEFSRELVHLVRRYGSSALDAIDGLINFGEVDGEIGSVALRTIGRVEHPASYTVRLRLLERALAHNSSWIRDGAALGLASLGDPTAIGSLQRAIVQEPIEELRQDLKAVEEYLETLR